MVEVKTSRIKSRVVSFFPPYEVDIEDCSSGGERNAMGQEVKLLSEGQNAK